MADLSETCFSTSFLEKMDNFEFRVQPWLDRKEWIKVKEMIVSGHLKKAKKMIETWKWRVSRLDSGMYIVQAML